MCKLKHQAAHASKLRGIRDKWRKLSNARSQEVLVSGDFGKTKAVGSFPH